MGTMKLRIILEGSTSPSKRTVSSSSGEEPGKVSLNTTCSGSETGTLGKVSRESRNSCLYASLLIIELSTPPHHYDVTCELYLTQKNRTETWVLYTRLSFESLENNIPSLTLFILGTRGNIIAIFNMFNLNTFIRTIFKKRSMFYCQNTVFSNVLNTSYYSNFFHQTVWFKTYGNLMTRGGVSLKIPSARRIMVNRALDNIGKMDILITWLGCTWIQKSMCYLRSVKLTLLASINGKIYSYERANFKERTMGDCERYNNIIMHETIRVAVIQQLMGLTTAPPELKRIMEASFLEYYDHYIEICEKNLHKDSQIMEDPFGEKRGRFCYKILLKNLKLLKTQIENNGIPDLPINPSSSSQLPAESDDVSSIISSLSEPEDAVVEGSSPTAHEFFESDTEPF
ncbi:unnamed protein product, partial [Meganyctiphanes norvegica]